MGLFAGMLADKYDRHLIINVSCILWSICTLLSGLIDSFGLFCFLRFLLGFFESGYTPSVYSLLSDYFHPDSRTIANSVLNCGIYLGVGLSSLTLLIVNAEGWRFAYSAVGTFGIAAGLIGIFVTKEPTRNKFGI